MNPESSNAVMLINIGRNSCNIGKISALTGSSSEHLRVHIARKSLLPKVALYNKSVRSLNCGIYSLLNSRDNRLTRDNCRVNVAMKPRPVAVLAKQTKTTRDKKLYFF